MNIGLKACYQLIFNLSLPFWLRSHRTNRDVKRDPDLWLIKPPAQHIGLLRVSAVGLTEDIIKVSLWDIEWLTAISQKEFRGMLQYISEQLHDLVSTCCLLEGKVPNRTECAKSISAVTHQLLLLTHFKMLISFHVSLLSSSWCHTSNFNRGHQV